MLLVISRKFAEWEESIEAAAKNQPGGAAAVKAALDKVRGETAGRGSSYRAQSPSARLRELTRTKRGRDILAATGFAPSRETQRRWSLPAGSPLAQKPGYANRQRINEAYEEMRSTSRNRSESAARRGVASAFTDALNYGATVRLRDIRSMRRG